MVDKPLFDDNANSVDFNTVAPTDYKDGTQFDGGDGNDAVTLGDNAEMATHGYDANTSFKAGDGDDLVTGSGDADNIEGGAGNDILSGNGGNDNIWGDAGADTINGGDGSDSLRGGDDNDVVNGDGGSDYIEGNDGDDILSGGDAADTLIGGAGNDILDGGSGDDTLKGGEGMDTVSGGSGNDTIFFTYGESGGLATPEVLRGGVDNDTLRIELTGADYAATGVLDELRAIEAHISANNDVSSNSGAAYTSNLLGITVSDFEGFEVWVDGVQVTLPSTTTPTTPTDPLFDGNDNTVDFGNTNPSDYLAGSQFDGGAGDDVVQLGTDAEMSAHGYAADTAFDGGAGDDQITGTADRDDIRGGDEDDTLIGAGGIDNLYGDDGNDVLSGGDGADNLRGGDGNDAIIGGNGSDYIEGNDGNDSLSGGDDADTILGGAGTDTLEGDDGDDTLKGEAGIDTVDAGAGNDTVFVTVGEAGTAGNLESLNGNTGTDTLRIEMTAAEYGSTGMLDELRAVARFVADNNDDAGNSGASYASNLLGIEISNFEGVEFYVDGNKVSLPPVGTGPGNAADPLFDGNDNTVDFSQVTPGTYLAGSQFEGGDGDDVVQLGTDAEMAGHDYNPNTSFKAGDGNDRVTGTDDRDDIEGGAGNDTLVGAGGTDNIWGDAGDDDISGGAGADSLRGGADNDTISGGDGTDYIEGNDGNDSLSGGDDADTILGGAGTDTLEGDDGDDTLKGEAGIDTVDAGAGNDTVFVTVGEAGTAGNLESLNGNTGTDTLRIEMTAAEYGSTGMLDELRAVARFVADNNDDAGNSGASYASNLLGIEISNFEGVEFYVDGNKVSLPPVGTGPGNAADPLFDGNDNTVDFSQVTPGTYLAGSQFEGGDGDDVVQLGTDAEMAGHDYKPNTSFKAGDGNDRVTGTNDRDDIEGGAGNDTLVGAGGTDNIWGDAGDDDISGGAGADSLRGGADNDTISGGDGTDYIEGNDGNDSLSGGDDADTILGGEGRDSISGGAGSDTLKGGEGVDSIDAGSDNDTVFVTYGEAGTTGDLEQLSGGKGVDTLRIEMTDAEFKSAGMLTELKSVAKFIADNSDDTLDNGPAYGSDLLGIEISNYEGLEVWVDGVKVDLGNYQDPNNLPPLFDDTTNVVDFNSRAPGTYQQGTQYDAGDSDDIVTLGNKATMAAHGWNVNVPNEADTALKLGDGNDTGYGSADDDGIFGGNGNDALYGADGNDSLFGDDGADLLDGGNGDDALKAGKGDDLILGGDGRDYMEGNDGNDRLEGGDGDDHLYGGAGVDSLHGDDGNDYLQGNEGADALFGGLGNDHLEGGADDDVLRGEEGDDYLQGNTGNDTIFGSVGRDNLQGQEGDDTLYGEEGSDWLYGGDGRDLLIGDVGDDVLEGDGGDDELRGGVGNDVLKGGDGEDEIFGGSGNDWAIGGAGNDVIWGSTGTDDLDGQDGDDTIYGDDGPEAPGATDYLKGGAGNDTLFGFGGNDTLTGGDDDDELHGGVGEDKLHGDAGNDTLYGGDGNDDLQGGDGDDRIFGGDGDEFFISGGAGNDYIRGGNGDESIHGGDGDDEIHGDAGDDYYLAGDAGNDTIYGGEGDDNAQGGEGDDVIDGGSGDDYYLSGGEGNDTIYGGSGSDQLHGDAGDDTLWGQEGNDYFMGGGDGRDFVHGGSGTDIVEGNAGVDQVFGGDDADFVVMESDEGGTVGDLEIASGDKGWDTLEIRLTEQHLNDPDILKELAELKQWFGETRDVTKEYTDVGNDAREIIVEKLGLQASNFEDILVEYDGKPLAIKGDALTVSEAAGSTSGDNLLANDFAGQGAQINTITYTDANGVQQTETLAQGGQLGPVATDKGTLTVYSNGDWKFDPDPQQHLAGDVIDTGFSYTAIDFRGRETNEVEQEIRITDTVPEANDDANSVDEGQSVSSNVMPNDVLDVDGGTVTAIAADGSASNTVSGATTVAGQYGDLVINEDGTYTYTADGSVPVGAVDTFIYTITDGDGDTATAQLVIDIDQAGGNLEVVGEVDTVVEGAAPVAGNVLDNDSGDNISVTPISMVTPLGGTIVIAANGDYTYTPPANADHSNGPLVESFTYTVTDAYGDTAQGTLDVTVEDTAPVADDDHDTVQRGDVTTGNVITAEETDSGTSDSRLINPGLDADQLGADATRVVEVNYTDENGNPATAYLPDGPGVTSVDFTTEHGDVTFYSDGSYEYEADDSGSGGSNGSGSSQTLTVGLSDPASAGAVESAFSGVSLSALAFGDDLLSGGKLNTTDLNSDLVSFERRGVGVQEQTGDNDNEIDYDLASGDSQALVISFGQDVQSAEVQVNAYFQQEGTGEIGTWTAFDTDGNQVATGSFGPNDATFIGNGVATVSVDPGVDFAHLAFTAGVMNGQTIGDNEDSSDYLVQQITYETADAGPAEDVMQYVLEDADGDRSSANLHINLTGEPDATPTVVDDVNSVVESAAPVTGNVLDNDDANGDGPLSVTPISAATALGGSIVINSDGTYSYTPPASLDHSNGPLVDSVEYTATDADGDSVVGTLRITVEDTAPVADDDYDIVESGVVTTGNVITAVETDTGSSDSRTIDPGLDADQIGADATRVVEVNYTDENGNPATAYLPDGPGVTSVDFTTEHGDVTFFSDGSYEYEADEFGTGSGGGSEGGETLSFGLPNGGSSSAMKEAWSDANFGQFDLQTSILDGNGKLNFDGMQTGLMTYTNRGVGIDEGNEGGLPVESQINHDPRDGDTQGLVINLEAQADAATFTVSNLYNTEASGEVGVWQAFDGEGNLVGSGSFGADNIDYGNSNNVGTVSISTDEPFQYLVFSSTYYGDDAANAGDRAGDSSDYFLRALEVTTVSDGPVEDVLEYVLEDADGDRSSANLHINVSEDTVPVPVDDTDAAVEGGSPVSGNVLDNDDANGDGPLSVTPVTAATALGGSIVINSDGTYSYTPPASLDHSDGPLVDSVEYTVTDSDGDTATATLNITIGDTAPDAEDDAKSVSEAGSVSDDVTDNDTFGADATSLTAISADGASSVAVDGSTTVEGTYGTLVINPDGTYTYTAAPNVPQGATDTFSYTLTDADGDTASADLVIDIDQFDGNLTVAGEADMVIEGSTTAVTGNVLDNDGGTGLTVTPVDITTPLGGTLVIEANGDYTYTAPANADHSNGPLVESFTYTVTDLYGDSKTATLDVTVEDTAPVADDDYDIVESGDTTTGNVITAVETDSDTSDSRTIDPGLDADQIGADATRVVEVNYTDENGNPATAYLPDGPGVTSVDFTTEHGDVTFFSDGSYEYEADDVGSAKGSGAEGGVTVSYGVASAGSAEQMGDAWDGAKFGQFDLGTPILDDGGKLNFDGMKTGILGVTKNGIGVDESGNGSLNYGAQINHDPDNNNSEGLVVDLEALADNATFTVSNLYKTEGSEETGVWQAFDGDGNLVGSGSFGGADDVEYGGSRHVGEVSITTDEPFQYLVFSSTYYGDDPANGPERGSDSSDYYIRTLSYTTVEQGPIEDVLEYVLEDADGDRSSANLHINVGDDPAPLPVDDLDAAIEGGDPVVGNVLDNDDANGEGPLSVTPVDGGTLLGGSIVINSDGTYSYTPPASLDHSNGPLVDEVEYTVTDADGDTATATLRITVGDTAPDAADDADQAVEGGSAVAGNVLDNDTAGADDVTVNPVTAMATALGGTISIAADGSYSYTPPAVLDHSNGPLVDQVEYTITDADGSTSTATLSITVEDTAPDADDDYDIVESGDLTTGNVITAVETDDKDTSDSRTIDPGLDADQLGADATRVTEVNYTDADGNPATAIVPNGDGVTSVSFTTDKGDVTFFSDGTYEYKAGDDIFGGRPLSIAESLADDGVATLTAGTRDQGGVAITTMGQVDGGDSGQVVRIWNYNDTETTYRVKWTGNSDTDAGAEIVTVGPGEQLFLNFEGHPTQHNTYTVQTARAGNDGTSTDEGDWQNVKTAVANKKDVSWLDNMTSNETGGSDGNGTATDEMTYVLTDADGDTDSAVLHINITEADDGPPTIEPVVMSVDEAGLPAGTESASNGETASGSLQVTDGDSWTVTAIGTDSPDDAVTGATDVDGTYGTLTINPDGSYSYTLTTNADHGNGASPVDAFTVEVTDADGLTATTTLTFTIDDDGPVAVDDALVMLTEGGDTYSGTLLTNNDAAGADGGISVYSVTYLDPSDGLETAVMVPAGGDTGPIDVAGGTLTVSSDGSWSFTPDDSDNAINPDVMSGFHYTLIDGDGSISDPAEQPIKVEDDGEEFRAPEFEVVHTENPTFTGVAFNGEWDPASGNVGVGDYLQQTEGRALTDKDGNPLENLPEGAPTVGGVDPSNMTLEYASPVTIQFQTEGAGYRNTVAWYQVDETGGIVDGSIRIVWQNASQVFNNKLPEGYDENGEPTNAGAELTQDFWGDHQAFQQNLGEQPAGTTIGFMLVPQGADSQAVWEKFGSLEEANQANWYIADDGKLTVDVGDQSVSLKNPAYLSHHSDENPVNPDGKQHTVSGLSGDNDGFLYVGFEDQSLGDRDFNDAVFRVDIGDANINALAGDIYDPDVVVVDDEDDVITKAKVEFRNAGDGESLIFDRDTAQQMTGLVVVATLVGGVVETLDLSQPLPDGIMALEFRGAAADEGEGAGEAPSYHTLLDTVQVSIPSDVIPTISEAYNYAEPRQLAFTVEDAEGAVSNEEVVTFQVELDVNDGTAIAKTIDGADDSQNTLIASNAGDTINAGNQGDQIFGAEGVDVINGGSGNDEIAAGSGDDIITAGGGDDYIVTGAGNDTVDAGTGDDTIIGDAGDSVTGGEGSDTFVYVHDANGPAESAEFNAGDGWADIIQLTAPGGADLGGQNEGGWTVEFTDDGISGWTDEAGGVLNDDSAGTITFANGTTLDFDGVEKIEWS